jgi:hypothetical protein
VTYDFARLMQGSKLVSCSAFGDALIKHMAGFSVRKAKKSARKAVTKLKKSARRTASVKKKARRR